MPALSFHIMEGHLIMNFGRLVSICNARVLLRDNADIWWAYRISVVGYLSGQASAYCPALRPSLLSNTDYCPEVTPARTGGWPKHSRSGLQSGPKAECVSNLEVSCSFFRAMPESCGTSPASRYHVGPSVLCGVCEVLDRRQPPTGISQAGGQRRKTARNVPSLVRFFGFQLDYVP